MSSQKNSVLLCNADQSHQFFLQGFEKLQKGDLTDAKKKFESALKYNAKNSDALHLLGFVYSQSKDWQMAADLIAKAIRINPKHPAYYSNRGIALKELGHLSAAVASFDKSIEINPNNAAAFSNRGNALQELKEYVAALASFDKAIALSPNNPTYHFNRGNALHKLKKLPNAMISLETAIRLQPNYHEAHYNYANILKESKRWEQAINHYTLAIQYNPNHSESHDNLGNVYQSQNKLEMALASYNKAIQIKPDFAEAYLNKAIVLEKLYRLDEAIENYEIAKSIKLDLPNLEGLRIHCKMRLCRWKNFELDLYQLIKDIHNNKKSTTSFPLLSLSDSSYLHRRCSEILINSGFPKLQESPTFSKNSLNRIRIAYFSADFNFHPVSILTIGLFQNHDKSKFEIFGFNLNSSKNDEMSASLQEIFDYTFDVTQKSDQEIAKLSRNYNIDIAIDLGGLTGDSRPGIFYYRAAPIQVNYLGYPGTMGADFMDYIIADPVLIPPEQQQHFSEKVVYLPHTFQATDRTRVISDTVFTREEFGLPSTAFVFCCFNNSYKITPDVFSSWMRIMDRVPDSVLWLLEDHVEVTHNLRAEAESRGVTGNRIVFAGRLPPPQYLARYRNADLFLDTLPYNAGTTCSDALWAGLPVLTYQGESFAGRMASSLLTAIDLPELITTSRDVYEARAIELATNPIQLQTIRDKLARNRLTTPLFDTALFTRHLEQSFIQMAERHHAGLAPEYLEISPVV